MSNNKNSRPTQIRSLKGPRRKLELEIHDGKRYIKKRDLQHYFFDENWRISDFKYHFGLGHRIVRGSLYKWFTAEEIDESHRKKIAEKQKGDRNSNSVNWYRPGKLIPLTELENAIKNSNTIREVKSELDLTSYELSYIQQYYNFRLPNKNRMIDDFSRHHLNKDEIKNLAVILKAFDLSKEFLSGNPRSIHRAIYKLTYLQYDLRIILKKLKKYYRDFAYHLPSNLIEYQFMKVLVKMGYKVVPQLFFKEANIHVDFLLNDSIVLELDGMMHDKEADKKRDDFLVSKGYKVVRINLKKESLNRFHKDREIRKCLKKYL